MRFADQIDTAFGWDRYLNDLIAGRASRLPVMARVRETNDGVIGELTGSAPVSEQRLREIERMYDV